MPGPLPRPLEKRYYLKHFEEVLTYVRQEARELMTPAVRSFMEAFTDLPRDARCLYVRLANRKGEVFRRSSLDYEELGDPGHALTDLCQRGFAREWLEQDFRAALPCFTKTKIIAMARAVGLAGIRTYWRKDDLLSFLTRETTGRDFFPRQVREELVVQEQVETVSYLFFLFYGRLRTGLTALALRDLGLLGRRGPKDSYQPRFASREAALAAFQLSTIDEKLPHCSREELLALAGEAPSWPEPDDDESDLLRHRVVACLGRHLERAKAPEAALAVYRLSDRHPAPERSVRLLHAAGRRQETRELLTKMVADPSCDDELLFAEDFYARKFKRRKVGLLTQMLRGARSYEIDEANRNRPESGVISLLARRGETAVHAENLVWNQLFGILFWELLQGGQAAPFHSEFDWRPTGLDSGLFYQRHQALIEEQLALLNEPETPAILEDRWKAHCGEANAFVAWFPETLTWVKELVERAPPGALASILRPMAQSHRHHRSGFPDLMVWGPRGLRLIEVKSDGDSLSRKQLARLEQLSRAGFAVEVGAVSWKLDPGQDYVVVDLESTGTHHRWHRITEIGAVRVKGGEVVDSWTTLINPGRKIPQAVVRLTGITDAMVAGAPNFAEIADSFREFLGEAVLVAHHAQFDYGFLRSEYRRLDQDLRCATFCTVAASRRLFPGHQSYGLAKLCRHFGITLEHHHRALSDARATADILLRIHEERKKRTSTPF